MTWRFIKGVSANLRTLSKLNLQHIKKGSSIKDLSINVAYKITLDKDKNEASLQNNVFNLANKEKETSLEQPEDFKLADRSKYSSNL